MSKIISESSRALEKDSIELSNQGTLDVFLEIIGAYVEELGVQDMGCD